MGLVSGHVCPITNNTTHYPAHNTTIRQKQHYISSILLAKGTSSQALGPGGAILLRLQEAAGPTSLRLGATSSRLRTQSEQPRRERGWGGVPTSSELEEQ
mgnify:CR=1 FL=1